MLRRITRRNSHRLWLAAALLLAAWALLPALSALAQLPDLRVAARPLPEFRETAPEAWINSPPLRLADLKGQVVLIEIWTTA